MLGPHEELETVWPDRELESLLLRPHVSVGGMGFLPRLHRPGRDASDRQLSLFILSCAPTGRTDTDSVHHGCRVPTIDRLRRAERIRRRVSDGVDSGKAG